MFAPGPNSTPDGDRGGLPTLDSSDGPPAAGTPSERPPAGAGNHVGRYRTLRVLDQGGVGVVYTAYDQLLDRVVALKTIRTDRSTSTDVGRFIREAKALARLSHPNIVPIHDVSISGGQVFLAMELIRGRTLRQHLAELGRPPHASIVALFIEAGRGLAAVHQAGLVHRDFKPKSRRPSPNAPQPTDRPHFHDLGRFERVDVSRVVPRNAGAPQNLAKGWQRLGPADDARVLTPGLCVPVFLLQRREAESCVVDDVLIFQQAAVPSPGQVR